MKKRISKFRLGKLFYNDKFVMCFSFALAFILWLYVASTTQEASVFTVTDIPVSLPELTHDLKYFNINDIRAEVRISGNALVVATVTSDDIYITAADTSFITSPGNYTLDLVPKKSGMKTDYSFESTPSPSSMNVYVDTQLEREFPITDKIIVSSVDENAYVSTTTLSQQTVKVSGAGSVVQSIAQVCAEYEFTSPLTQTTVVNAPLVFYDEDGKKIDTRYITSDITRVDATVPILKAVTVDITPSVANLPETLHIADRIHVTPSSVKIAVPNSVSTANLEVLTSDIDFSEVSLSNNTFETKLTIPSGCKVIDGTEKAEVKFDMTDMTLKTLTLSDFSVINEGTEQSTSVSAKSLSITLIGSKEQLASLTASNVTAVIDMSQKSSNFVGMAEMAVTVNLNSKFDLCWVYGSYTVSVTASRKSENSSE